MEDVSLGTISPGVEGLKDLGASNKAFFWNKLHRRGNESSQRSEYRVLRRIGVADRSK